MTKTTLQDFLDTCMMKGSGLVPARLQTALALLERLRDFPSLKLADHQAARGSSGLRSHETYGDRAHKRFGIEPLNKNHGRRSSNLADWGQKLLDMVDADGFLRTEGTQQNELTTQFQTPFAEHLRKLLQQEPLKVRVRGRSAKAAIADAMQQAEEKGKAAEVAQYLVGAKLMLKYKCDIPAYPANKGDRKSRRDEDARLGDFEIKNGVLEIALGLPDAKHLDQVAQVLENPDSRFWLITRADRVATWKTEFAGTEGIDLSRADVMSVEQFVGRNITELVEFDAKAEAEGLKTLFDIYNTRWIDKLGPPGLRIITT